MSWRDKQEDINEELKNTCRSYTKDYVRNQEKRNSSKKKREAENMVEDLLEYSITTITNIRSLLKSVEDLCSENAKLSTLMLAYSENVK